MFINRTAREDLETRLDSSFYCPDAVRIVKQISSRFPLGRLGAVIDKTRRITNGVRGPDWAVSEYKLIRLQDCRDWIVEADNAASISHEQFFQNIRCSLSRGDIVVAIGGYVGNAAVFLDDSDAVIGQHSALLPIDPEGIIDGRFLLAYLNCLHGEIVFQRYVSGTVQAGVNLEDIRDLPAPLPDTRAQLYIGNKVRQAERLRAWAKATEKSVSSFHVGLTPKQDGLDFSKRRRRVAMARLTDRMDAHFYPAVVDEYLRSPSVSFRPLRELCHLVINGQTLEETTSASDCHQISVANLSRTFVKGTYMAVNAPADPRRLLQTHDLLLCNAAHNKDYIGREITYWHGEAKILPSTEVMIVRTDREQLPASYLRAYLLTKLGYVQLQSTIRGITAHSYPQDVKKLDIPVPVVADELRDQWFACDDLMAQAGQAVEAASQLTTAAKLLVEALIEGQLTESDLIAAQQALEAGDDGPDRAILARLTADGLDGSGAPLFPDLDRLATLLARAASETAGDAD
jgi:type I restriction enzyme, S subunit